MAPTTTSPTSDVADVESDGVVAWHGLSTEEIEERLDTGRVGLAVEEAVTRLERIGPNEIESEPPPSPLVTVLAQFRSPLITILLVAAAATLVLGEYIDAAVIAAVLTLNATIGYIQERKAERSVRALSQLMSLRAHVVRDGRERDVESRELVPGDLVLLESGQRVPADLRIVRSTALAVDESLLTGESVPVGKHDEPIPAETPATERRNIAYTATTVTSGRARGYVIATGVETELGSIAESMRAEEMPKTPLQLRMDRLANLIGAAIGVAAIAAFVLGWTLGEEPGHMFAFAVGLAVAAIPEGLPVVLTVTLAVGVHRMAQRNAIIRRLGAVETLGSTTVIGSDKTGTLTANRMTVQEVRTLDRSIRFDEFDRPPLDVEAALSGRLDDRALVLTMLAGVLSNEAHVEEREGETLTRGDPTEVALLLAADHLGLLVEDVRGAFGLEAEAPFESERAYSASVRSYDHQRYVFVKGAPERVLEICETAASPDGDVPLDHDLFAVAAEEMAAQGLRVLGMAFARLDEADDAEGACFYPSGLTFVGLQGMLDPPRSGVAEAIDGCRQAGMRVVMITGDHAVTARAIAGTLGIGGDDPEVVSGTDVDEMDDADLLGRCAEVDVFARVSPAHKLRITRALQSRGEVVAVTGDGVNDGPALKAADIGIAMGRDGTDVAREAADMVLADDNFVSIYAAVEQGRITFDNVRKATFFLLATGVGLIIALFVALGLGWPLLFLPAQLLWLNLVTNGLQDVALAFEPGEPGLLDRPPRSSREGVMSPLLWERTVLAAAVMAAGTLLVFWHEMSSGSTLEYARTAALTTMVLFQTFHLGNARSERRSVLRTSPTSNRFLFAAVILALAVHAASLHLAPTQFILRVEPISLSAWMRSAAVAGSVVVVGELHKLARHGTSAFRRAVPNESRP